MPNNQKEGYQVAEQIKEIAEETQRIIKKEGCEHLRAVHQALDQAGIGRGDRGFYINQIFHALSLLPT